MECKGGAALSDEQVLGMNSYVKGIDDGLPQWRPPSWAVLLPA